MSVYSERWSRRTAKPYRSPKGMVVMFNEYHVYHDVQWQRSNNKKFVLWLRHKNGIKNMLVGSEHVWYFSHRVLQWKGGRLGWPERIVCHSSRRPANLSVSILIWALGLADTLPPMKWLTLDGLTSRGNGAGQYQTAGIHWIPQCIINTLLQGTAGFGGGWGICTAK